MHYKDEMLYIRKNNDRIMKIMLRNNAFYATYVDYLSFIKDMFNHRIVTFLYNNFNAFNKPSLSIY